MKVLFVCMGSMLSIYNSLARELKQREIIDSACFYISDRNYYDKYLRTNRLEGNTLCEWDIFHAPDPALDLMELQRIEQRYFSDEPYAMSMLVDRRIFNGKYTKVKQHYRSTYSHDEMLSLFYKANIMLEEFIKRESPSFILGVTPSTFGDYLCYKHSHANKLGYLQLRPTKFLNYCTLSTDIREHHQHIRNQYSSYRLGGKAPSPQQVDFVNNYLEQAKKERIVYEGNIGVQNIYFTGIYKNLKDFLHATLLDLKMLGKSRDNHHKGLYTKIFIYDRLRRLLVQSILYKAFRDKSCLSVESLPVKYVFFPLHAEPEISLTIFCRENLNQIEVIRQLALHLPIGHKLIVKEHPRNVGRRSLRYYKKMLEIPGVLIAHHSMPSMDLIHKSSLVAVLSSFVGFEAALLKKPVITLGRTIYNILPDSMVLYCEKYQDLFTAIRTMMDHYRFDQNAIESFLYSIMDQSERLDLYTVLLRKENREGGKLADKNEYMHQISLLADYFSRRLSQLDHTVDTIVSR